MFAQTGTLTIKQLNKLVQIPNKKTKADNAFETDKKNIGFKPFVKTKSQTIEVQGLTYECNADIHLIGNSTKTQSASQKQIQNFNFKTNNTFIGTSKRKESFLYSI